MGDVAAGPGGLGGGDFLGDLRDDRTLIAFYYTQDRAFVQAKLTPTFILVVVVLMVVIPFVLYKALKLWLEGEISPFPDIDHAWKAGLGRIAAARH